MDFYIKFDDTQHMTLPMLFSDILIYCTERNVMLVDHRVDDNIKAKTLYLLAFCVNMDIGMQSFMILLKTKLPNSKLKIL